MGSGNTREEAASDHEQNLRELQKNRCTERNTRVNNEKSILKQTQVKFMGHPITNEGIQAGKSKVEAIFSMPAPTDIHGVKRFWDMIQYLSKFLPNPASDLRPIGELTKKMLTGIGPLNVNKHSRK